jgi:neutral ceramidase
MSIFLRVLFGLLGFATVAIVASIAPVDDTPYQQTDFYAETTARLAKLASPPPPTKAIQAGWAKVNLTPAFTTPTAGYGAREGRHWTQVKDSIFVRATVLDNGSTKVAVVSADLLIFPPAVTAQLKQRLPEVGFHWENTFVGATHTHNSLGAWADGPTGKMFGGEYDTKVVQHITDIVLKAIKQANTQLAPVEIGYAQVYVADMIRNRLVKDAGTIDAFVRMLKLRKASGESALLCTYAAHATTLDADKEKWLSRDYPGALVDSLEKRSASFAMFMAGAVGSMGPLEEEKDDWKQLENEAAGLQIEIEKTLPRFIFKADSTLGMLTLPLTLRDPHARIANGWRMRPWLFYKLFGDYPTDLKALRIGNTILLGTPCDFSGELVNDFKTICTQKGVNLMITSFNGGYVGYITPDKYYGMDSYETRTMNWFGPQNAAYFEELMQGLISKL